MGFPGALVVKNPSANAGDIRNMDSIPGSGRSPGGEDGSPLQYSCLENPMDRGAWQDTIHRVAKSQTRLKPLSTHVHAVNMLDVNTLRTGQVQGEGLAETNTCVRRFVM